MSADTREIRRLRNRVRRLEAAVEAMLWIYKHREYKARQRAMLRAQDGLARSIRRPSLLRRLWAWIVMW